MDGTLTDTTTLGQSGPGSNDNEEELHIPQGSRTGASPSDGEVSYLAYTLEKSLTSSAMMQSVYSTAQANKKQETERIHTNKKKDRRQTMHAHTQRNYSQDNKWHTNKQDRS